MPAQRVMSDEAGTRTAVLLSLLVSAAFAAALLDATDGRFVPPIADLYVVCQYARAMADGHPFSYHAGEAASTGATSLLHTAWLALGYRLGLRADALVGFAMASGAAMFALTAAAAARLAQRLAGGGAGVLAGLLVALGGPVAWGFLYGSDIAMFLWLATWLFERLVATWGEPGARSALVPASLLALARPEGLPIALALGAAWVARGGGPRCAAPAVLGLVPLATNRLLTGHWLSSSVADKSLFAAYGMDGGLALLAEYAVDVVRGLLLGFYPSQAPVGLARGWASLAFPPLGLVFVGAAVMRLGSPVRLWFAVIAAVWALGAPNLFLGVHFNRYLLWAFPSLLVLVAVGVGQTLGPRAGRWVAGLLLCLGGASTLRFALLYAEMAGGLARRDVPAAAFIAATLPRDAVVANAATSVEYLSERRSANLHGVTSPEFFGGRAAEREASMLEALARLPAARRPGYLLSSERAQEAQAGLRAIAPGPPLFRSSSLSDDELVLLATRFDALDDAASVRGAEALAPLAGLEETDRLNVGDPVDEERHGYRAATRLGGLRLFAGVRVGPDAGGALLADAGRAVLGSESFRLRHGPGDLVLVLRTAASVEAPVWRASGPQRHELTFDRVGLTILATGREAARAEFAPGPGWEERAFRVPAALLGTDETRFEVRGRFASFRYWAFQ